MRTRVWRFGNCQIVVGYLVYRDAVGIEFAWGRREPRDPGERLFDRAVGVAVGYSDFADGLIRYMPAAWFHDPEGQFDSRLWTGRGFVLWRIARPFCWSH